MSLQVLVMEQRMRKESYFWGITPFDVSQDAFQWCELLSIVRPLVKLHEVAFTFSNTSYLIKEIASWKRLETFLVRW